MWSLEREGRVHRLTFSLSLAEHIARLAGGLSIVRRRFTVGKALAPGEQSASGAYALVDVRKGKTLRLQIDLRVADLLRGESRRVHEAWLV